MVRPHCCRLTWTEINGIAACRCVAAAEPPWNSLHSIYPPLPALHMFSFERSSHYLNQIHPNSKAQCNLWKWKELSVSHKFFCLVEIEQPLLVAKLKRAEINGFRAGRCVCGGRRAAMKFSLFHMMSISTSCSSHVSLARSCHTWTKFIQIQNAVQLMKWKKIVGGLTQVFLSRRDWTASVGCKADTGWDKCLQSWSLFAAAAEPPWNSLCSIWCPSPLPALHMFLLQDLVILEPNSSKFKTQCNLLNGKKLSAVSRRFFWSVEIEQPLLVAKADTGWDKCLQSWSLCVAAAEPPWNSIYSIWCPSPLPALHIFLLKDLVMLEPTPNSFANKANEVRAMWYAQHKTVLWKQVWVLECVVREIIRFVLENYAYLRLGSFESGCMHNLLKSIPAPRCLKSWTC